MKFTRVQVSVEFIGQMALKTGPNYPWYSEIPLPKDVTVICVERPTYRLDYGVLLLGGEGCPDFPWADMMLESDGHGGARFVEWRERPAPEDAPIQFGLRELQSVRELRV